MNSALSYNVASDMEQRKYFHIIVWFSELDFPSFFLGDGVGKGSDLDHWPKKGIDCAVLTDGSLVGPLLYYFVIPNYSYCVCTLLCLQLNNDAVNVINISMGSTLAILLQQVLARNWLW